MKIFQFSIIQLEWNSYNGFIFDLLYLSIDKPNIDGSLFGVNISKNFFYLDLFWRQIKIFDKTDNFPAK